MKSSWLVKYGFLLMALNSVYLLKATAPSITEAGSRIVISNENYTAVFDSEAITFTYPDDDLVWKWSLKGNSKKNCNPFIANRQQVTKVTYEREDLIEEYVVKPQTIEQLFIIKERPKDDRDLIIEGNISSNGILEESENHWGWKKGNKKIALGRVYTYDADGLEIPSEMSVTNNSNKIIIKKEFLKHAKYPIIIDPEIGDEVVVISGSPYQTRPASVFNSTSDEVLTIWSEPKVNCASNVELKGQKINPVTGEKIGNAFRIFDITADCESATIETPSIAYDQHENQYFIILKAATNSSKKVIGFTTNEDGELTGETIEFASSTFGDPFKDLIVQYDPTNKFFLAGYHLQIGASEMELHLQKINAQTGQKDGNELIINKTSIPIPGNTGPKSSQIILTKGRDKFLLIFHVNDAITSEIWGTTVEVANFSSPGSFFQVSPNGTSSDQYKNPSITYNSVNDEFMVVYEDVDLVGAGYEQVANIYGQRISTDGVKLTGVHNLVSKIPLTGCGGCIEQTKLPKSSFSLVKNEYFVSFFGAPTSSGNEIYDIYGARLDPSDLSIINNESFLLLSGKGTTVIDNNNLMSHDVLYFPETDKFLFTWFDLQTNEIAVQIRKYENHAPTGLNLSENFIDENQSENFVIGNLSSVDLDDEETFTYSLVAGDGDTGNSLFNINSNELRSNIVFDFENEGEKSIRVRTTDSHGESFEEIFTILINDINESPSDIELDNQTILEFSPEGTLIGNLSAFDPDANSTLTYQLISGMEYFKIESDQLKTNVVFDFIEMQSIPVTIKVVDNSNLEFSQEFTIEILEYPDFEPPVINQQVFKTTFSYSNFEEEVSIQASDDNEISGVSFYYKQISGSEWSSFKIEPEYDVYPADITKSMLDEMGIIYFFEVSDFKHKVYSDTTIMTLTFQEGDLKLTDLDFGGREEDYEIIAIPYELENNSIAGIFEDDLGKQSPNNWRFLSYEDGNCCKEYPGSLNSVERGKGYWFNQREKHDISIGSGQVDGDLSTEYFEIQLVQGWNQIGNPFPFTINWSDVVESGLNGSLFTTGKVSNGLYQYKNGNFIKDGVLPAFRGAFVSAEGSVSIKIPLQSAGSSNGRKADQQILNPLDHENWEVPIVLTQGRSVFSIGAIGMHPEANNSRDKFDELLIPRFGNYLEYSFKHPEHFYPEFARDIVKTENNHSWHFNVSARSEGHCELSWNNDYFGNNRMNLVLFDLSSGWITDMRKTDNYHFTLNGDKPFRILFGDDEYIRQQLANIEAVAGFAYPNPFINQLNIPLVSPGSQSGHDIDLKIYDSLGKVVYQKTYQSLTENINMITWNGESNSGEYIDTGIYIYKIIVSNTGKSFSGKVVKK